MNEKNTFCPLLWLVAYVRTNGSTGPCCFTDYKCSGDRFSINSKQHINARKQMLNGKRPEICNTCWALEDKGIQSFREYTLKLKSEKYKKAEYVKHLDEIYPYIYDIRLNNICNLACRMCNSQYSSKLLENGEKPFNWFSKDEESKLIKNINKSIKFWGDIYLTIAGGESFASRQTLNLINNLINLGLSNKINLEIISNFTINSSILSKLTLFKSINLYASVDGIGKVNDYIRYPSKFSVIEKNIINIKNIKITLVPSISIYNILYVDEIIKWAESYDLDIYFGHVTYPEYLFVGNFPKIIPIAIEKLNKIKSEKYYDKIKELIKWIEDIKVIGDSFDKFSSFTEDLDNKRNQSLKDSLPELYKELYG